MPSMQLAFFSAIRLVFVYSRNPPQLTSASHFAWHAAMLRPSQLRLSMSCRLQLVLFRRHQWPRAEAGSDPAGTGKGSLCDVLRTPPPNRAAYREKVPRKSGLVQGAQPLAHRTWTTGARDMAEAHPGRSEGSRPQTPNEKLTGSGKGIGTCITADVVRSEATTAVAIATFKRARCEEDPAIVSYLRD